MGLGGHLIRDAARQPTILWASLDVAPATPEHCAFSGAMVEFSDVVARITGCRTGLAQVMPKKLREWCIAEACRAADLPDFCCGWMDACHDELGYLPKGMLLCTIGHPLASSAKRTNPLAQWGASNGGVSVYYGPLGKEPVWHEALHLLGAEDCYDDNGKGPTCGLPNCIMQWEPPQHGAAHWPFLCDRNCRAVRQWVEAFGQKEPRADHGT